MTLRNLNIGTRLSIGFGFTLAVSGVMLATALISGSISREAIQKTLLAASARREAARSMEEHLLRSAVSVRNMGLQTTVEAVQKDEAEAKSHRAAYMESWKVLDSLGLPAEQHRLTLPLGTASHNRRHYAARFSWAASQARSNCIGLT